MMQWINRVQQVLLHPAAALDSIKAEQVSEKELLQQFVVLVAAVPAIAGLLGSLFEGGNFFRALLWGVLFFCLSVAGVWITAKILTSLAPSFEAKTDYISMLKLAAYTFTPIFLACIFFLIPPIYGLSILGIYGFYLFWIGLPRMIQCPAEELFNFRAIGIIVIAVAILVIFIISAVISGTSVYYLSI